MADLLQVRSYFNGVIARIRGRAWKLVINSGAHSRAVGVMRVHAGFQVNCGRAGYRIEIAEGFHAKRWCSVTVDGGSLSIGRNLFMNNHCSINCLDRITIGDDCLFGEGVSIYDHDHVFSSLGKIRDNGFKRDGVEIGSNVWLGSNVIVLRGSIIGDNVVVGANTVVKGIVPSNSVVVDSSRSTPKISALEIRHTACRP